MTSGASRSNTAPARGNMLSAANGSTGSEPEQPKQDKSRARPDRLGAPALVSEGARLPRTEREAGPPMGSALVPRAWSSRGGPCGRRRRRATRSPSSTATHTRGCIKAIRLRLPQFPSLSQQARVGGAPAPQTPGLAFWSDIGSLRSPPFRRETSSPVHAGTGGAAAQTYVSLYLVLASDLLLPRGRVPRSRRNGSLPFVLVHGMVE
jgi:hypothetical protein